MQKKSLWLQATVPALAILILLAFMGCSSTSQSANKKLSAEDFTLTYSDKAQVGSEVNELTLQHPLRILERQMVFHLVALRYENNSLLSKPGPVFTKEDIQKMKRLLTKALTHADPQHIIGFEVESGEGTTQGELFASNGKLHWRFIEIQGTQHTLTRNPTTRYGAAWRMLPGKGQKTHVTDQFLGTRQWTNWIEAKINLPAPANLKIARPKKDRPTPGVKPPAPPPSSAVSPPPAAPSPPLTAAPKNDPAELEEKLKFLKHLHENQLIDPQEYEKKRKDLLDQYL